MYKKLITFGVTLVALQAPMVVSDDGKFYFGGSLGMSTVDTGITTTVNTTVDDSDTGAKLLAGIRLNDNVSLEGHWANLGEAVITMQNGGSYVVDGETVTNNLGSTLTIKADGKSIGAGVVIHGDYDSDIVPFAKAGYQKWDSSASLSISGINVRIEDDGTDPFYGAGIMFRLSDDMTIRGEYESFDFDGDNVTFASLGFVLGF